MAVVSYITGMREVIRNLRRQDKRYAAGISMGLRKAGVLVRRTSQQYTPVEYGNLKGSAFTRHNGEGMGTVVTVGYTAAYAAWIHERTEMKWKGRPRAGARYSFDTQGKLVNSKGKRISLRGRRKGRFWDPQGRAKAHFLRDAVIEKTAEVQKIVRDTAVEIR